MTRNNGETSSALPCKVKNYLSNQKGESATDRAKDHGRSSWLTTGPSARDPRFPTLNPHTIELVFRLVLKRAARCSISVVLATSWVRIHAL